MDHDQAERARRGNGSHQADQATADDIGVDDGENGEPRGRHAVDAGAENQGCDGGEGHDWQQCEHQSSGHKRQPNHGLPGASQCDAAPAQWNRARHAGPGDRLTCDFGVDGVSDMRNAMGDTGFQPRERTPDGACYQPFGDQGASQHQRELPGDVEEDVIGVGVGCGLLQPVPEQRKARNGLRGIGDLVGDVAELLGNREQKLCAEAVRCQRRCCLIGLCRRSGWCR